MPFKSIPQEEKRKRINLTLGPKAHAELKHLSHTTGEPMSRILDRLIMNDTNNPHTPLNETLKRLKNQEDKVNKLLNKI